MLIQHRPAREAAILAALRSHGPATAATLASCIYTDTPSPPLPAATHNVLAHLIDLTARSQTLPAPVALVTTLFHAV